MDYKVGRLGRVVVARFDHREDLLASLKVLCEEAGIGSAWFFLFGALTRGTLVVGPEEEKIPPIPVKKEIEGPYEILATGSVARDEGEISIHVHSSLGSKRETLSGCIREKGEIYLVVECLILEVDGLDLHRKMDPLTGLKLLAFSSA
jgi:predicted DNA-binding protein with PD1-like motif